MKKKIPTLATDVETEWVVDRTDLSKYDLSGLKGRRGFCPACGAQDALCYFVIVSIKSGQDLSNLLALQLAIAKKED